MRPLGMVDKSGIDSRAAAHWFRKRREGQPAPRHRQRGRIGHRVRLRACKTGGSKVASSTCRRFGMVLADLPQQQWPIIHERIDPTFLQCRQARLHIGENLIGDVLMAEIFGRLGTSDCGHAYVSQIRLPVHRPA